MSIPVTGGETPNVRITNPLVRKVVGNIFGYAGLAIAAAAIVDSSISGIDLAWFLAPASSIVLGLFGLYQTVVTSANVPTAKF